MATIITELKEKYQKGNICLQLIYINVTVFVLVTVCGVLLQLFNYSLDGRLSWLELPA